MTDVALKRYANFFEQLGPDNLHQFSEFFTEDIHFVDPFNDIHGLKKLEKIFQHMYANLDDAKFTVTHVAMSDATMGNDLQPRGLLRWELHSTRNSKPFEITGMSEVAFASDGRVNVHIDHWDSAQQFYARLPVIGWLLGLIRSKLTV